MLPCMPAQIKLQQHRYLTLQPFQTQPLPSLTPPAPESRLRHLPKLSFRPRVPLRPLPSGLGLQACGTVDLASH